MLTRIIARNNRPRKSRAQGMVEFALILPVLLLTIFVIVELARVLHAWMAIENGARFGVRYAVTGEFDEVSYCGGSCATEVDEELARIPSVKDAAKAGAVAILKNDTVIDIDTPGWFQVTVCSNNPDIEHKAGNPSTPSATKCVIDDGDDDDDNDVALEHAGEPGETVIVTVEFTHPLITPMISTIWPDLHLRAQRTGIVEQYRTSRVFGLPISAFTTPPTPTNTFTPIPTNTPVPTATDTPTPTPSNTPTSTPTPSCSNIYRVAQRLRGDDFEVRVRNDNVAPAYLSSAYLEWEEIGSMRVDKFKWDGSTYHNDWPDDGGASYDYTSSTGPAASWEIFNGGGNRDWWEVDFNRAPSPLWGDYSVDLIFGFEDMALTCPISGFYNQAQLPTSTPQATSTPGPSPTSRPSRTPSPPTATSLPGATATTTPDAPEATATIDWGDG